MGWEEDGQFEYEDIPEHEDHPRELDEDRLRDLEERGIWWVESIREIKEPERQEKAMDRAENLLEEREDLLRRDKLGEIDDFEFWRRNLDLNHEFPKEAFKADMQRVFRPGELEEMSETYDNLLKGDPKWIDINARLYDFIKRDPDGAQMRADHMFEEGEIAEEAYRYISERVKWYKR